MFHAPFDYHDEPRIPRWMAHDLGLSPHVAGDALRLRARRRTLRRRPDAVERAVGQVPLFSALAPKRRRAVAQLVRTRAINERAVVGAVGSHAREFLVVVDGTLVVLDDDQVVATRGPGSHAGAASLLTKRPRATSLVAATPVVALVANDRDFARLLDEVPEVSERLHADIGRSVLAGIPPEGAA
jgi:CRP-like cAMP-binding protein